jgi:holo-[acyl-carrier protein] synthase
VIYGIGIDVVEPQRVARLLEKYGERFARRVLTAREWPAYEKTGKRVLFLANRFAAKEAFSKAMGTGFRYPVTLQCVSVVQDRLGKPGLEFNAPLAALMSERRITGHHVTISDERTLACACVVLEAVAHAAR